MKKYIIAAMMAVASVFAASAENGDGYSLLINTGDGNVVEYEFQYYPVATFDGDEMVITDEWSAESMRYNIADIVNMTIKKPATGVAEVNNNHLKVAVTKDNIRVTGLAEGASIAIYNMAGSMVASATAGKDGSVNIAVNGLGTGVFVATMPGNSFKFIR